MDSKFQAEVSRRAEYVRTVALAHGRNLSNEHRFYNYVFLDERKPGTYVYDVFGYSISFDYEPFYVGKGTGRRIRDHKSSALRGADTRMAKKIRSIEKSGHKALELIVFSGDVDAVSIAKETMLIEAIGRDSVGGTLINLTDGGDGMSGYICPDSQRKKHREFRHSEESIAKISAAHMGKVLTKEHKDKLSAAKKGRPSNNLGTRLTDAQKKNLSEKLKGRVISESSRKKIGAAHRGRKRPEGTGAKIGAALKARPPQTCQYCGFVGTGGFTRWHGENCKNNPKNGVKNGL